MKPIKKINGKNQLLFIAFTSVPMVFLMMLKRG